MKSTLWGLAFAATLLVGCGGKSAATEGANVSPVVQPGDPAYDKAMKDAAEQRKREAETEAQLLKQQRKKAEENL